MVDLKKPLRRVSRRTQIAGGAAALLILGTAGGAGAIAMTRPSVEMAPTVPTAIHRLPQTSGIVTVKGKVAEVYGNQFIVQDRTGRTLVDAGPQSADALRSGTVMTVQGRYDNGKLRASYLVDPEGQIEAVGGRPPHGPHRIGPDGPGRDGPPPPPPGDKPPPTPVAGRAPPPPSLPDRPPARPGIATPSSPSTWPTALNP